MIEKLQLQSNERLVFNKDFQLACRYIQNKINEIADTVNELQKNYDNVCIWVGEQKLNYNPDTTKGLSTLVEEPDGDDAIQEVIHADPFAEQRKWIGKLCKFWDFVYDSYYFDTLKGITDEGLFIGHNGSWEHCEPVKPTDSIIYKGE